MQYLRRAETETNNCSDNKTLNLGINQGYQHITREFALNPDSIRRGQPLLRCLGKDQSPFCENDSRVRVPCRKAAARAGDNTLEQTKGEQRRDKVLTVPLRINRSEVSQAQYPFRQAAGNAAIRSLKRRDPPKGSRQSGKHGSLTR